MKKIKLLICSLLLIGANVNAANYNISAGDYYYLPSSLSINTGDTVNWINDGGYHNVNFSNSTISGNSFNNPVSFVSSPTASYDIYTYVFTVPGTYEYDCSVGSHAQNGMVGTITVNTSNSIYDIVENSADHTTLEIAIDACGLDGVLSDPGSLTLFAPTDAAFNLLPPGTVAALLADIPTLTDILTHHVVAANVPSSALSNGQVVTTLLGTGVTVTINSMGVYIDNAMVTIADITADNGVVHVIDAVLIPTTTDIIDYSNLEKVYLHSVNILGEKVNKSLKNQVIFNVYQDGSIDKIFNK